MDSFDGLLALEVDLSLLNTGRDGSEQQMVSAYVASVIAALPGTRLYLTVGVRNPDGFVPDGTGVVLAFMAVNGWEVTGQCSDPHAYANLANNMVEKYIPVPSYGEWIAMFTLDKVAGDVPLFTEGG